MKRQKLQKSNFQFRYFLNSYTFLTNLLLLSLSLSPSLALMAAPPSQSPQEVDNSTQSALQKHVSFFDRDGDGIIYPKETYQGFRAIGCGIPLSTFAAAFINVGLSAKTRPGESFTLKFPIVINNINLGKHGSDTGAYDEAGRFVPSKFDEIFEKHARANGNSLTSEELMGMLKANRVPKGYSGWVASYVEWKILYDLCKDKNGLLQKDTVRAVYDGSLFEQLARKNA